MAEIRKRGKQGGMLSLADRTAARLREEIRRSKYGVGDQIPDEHSLARQYEVSRGTIRQALGILGAERLIVKHQGRGTFVSNPSFGTMADKQTKLLGIMVYEKEY